MATLAKIRKQRAARLPHLILAAAAALAASAAADWSVQSPIPTALEIRGVAVPEPGRIFLATQDDSFDDGGALFESTDGGATWAQRAVPESLSSDFHGVFFLDADHGWAWGNESYRTLDGGSIWEPLPPLGSVYGMHFYSTTFGVANGNGGASVSRDGGLTWEASPEGMYTFSFQGALGVGASATGLHRSTDGGDTFAPVRPGAAAAVALLSGSLGVAIVDDTFVRSTDGGATWDDIVAAAGKSELFAVSGTVALAFGRTGAFPNLEERIFRTDNGGASWTDLGDLFASGNSLVGLAFAKSVTGDLLVADGFGGLQRSIDAGATWSPVFASPGPSPGFLSTTAPVFADATTAYYGCGGGLLVRSTDGGASWSQLSSGAGESLLDLVRFAGGDLLAVGNGGTVLTSAGGGTPWQNRGGAGSEPLVAAQAIGPAEAVVVDASGRAHHSTDSGATWNAMAPLPNVLSAADVHFQSALTGWIVGSGFDGHSLFRSTDGGGTWAGVGDIQGAWVALDFAADHGWALRYDGLLYRSTDDGATWSDDVLLPGPPPTVHDIEFWDTAIGYAVGSGGYAVRSSDGGATWTALWTPDSGENLVDIDLLGPGELWVAAADGTTWYSATGGQSWSVMEAGTNGFGGYSAVVGDPAGNAWIAGTLGAIRRFAGPPPPPVNQPPVAAFGYLATGLSIAFTDQSSDADGTVVSWQWEFGDGATSAEPSPTHLYAEAGTYFVSLTVTDDDGGIDATGAAIVAQPLPGGTFGEFTEVTPLDPLFVTPADEDFWVASAAPADVDGDGDLDIAALGFYVVYNVSVEHRLVLMSNQGPGAAERWQLTYVDAPIGELTAGASDLAWGDVDNDADPDLVVGSDGLTVLYRNDAGTLVPTPTELPGYWEDSFQAEFDLRSITWADFDNDGDLDLLLPSIWDDELFEFRTALLRNDGADGAGGLVFTDANAGLPPTPHAQTQWADADGDQDLDLLFIGEAPGTDSGFIRLFRNDGVGGFTGEEILGTLSVERGEAQWGDYDQDGDLDVLVAGNVHLPDDTYDTVLHIYRNDAEIYTPVPVIDCPECEGWFDLSAATWADYDSDGDMDILLAGTWNSGSQIEGRAKIYANVGGVFVAAEGQLPAPRSMGDRGGAFTWLDLDGEGDLDYFIAGAYFVPGGNGLVEAQMHLYVNDASSQNQPPSAPANLSAEVSLDGVVSLGWTAATDDSTPAETLTYELRLRRGSIVLTPLRLLPEPGGLSAVLEWTILGLADGHYTWKLVAVDSAYNSGPAAQGSFDVGEPPAPLFADGFESGTTGGWSAQAP